ncbi:bile acid:sodium symporter family protein [Robiginitalea sp.]|uniref:bile acid:sodium symporter family protein n=2 Tax=Robiginitalea sp. TaxID=1902411 RepID=UPI003C7705D8
MTVEEVFKIVVMIFTVSNLAAMGLEINKDEALKALKNPRFIILILVWGWIAGPAIAYGLTKVIPLSEAHAAGLLLISLAPTAPFFPLMVTKARGDMSSAGAFILVATIGTVIFLPLMVPLLIKGLVVSVWGLAKPLLLMVLLPLLIGFSIKVYKNPFALKIAPAVKKIGSIFLLITAAMTLWLYWEEMLSAIGSFAIGAQILFFVLITVLSYKIPFGLKKNQRSGMALGMCTRNIAAVFVAYFGIVNPDPEIFVMIVLVVPLALIVALIAAKIFAKDAAS